VSASAQLGADVCVFMIRPDSKSSASPSLRILADLNAGPLREVWQLQNSYPAALENRHRRTAQAQDRLVCIWLARPLRRPQNAVSRLPPRGIVGPAHQQCGAAGCQ
jgi:hypothetical protein